MKYDEQYCISKYPSSYKILLKPHKITKYCSNPIKLLSLVNIFHKAYISFKFIVHLFDGKKEFKNNEKKELYVMPFNM